MPCPALTAETENSLLSASKLWDNLGVVYAWLNGGTGGGGTDFDHVRFTHLPRPAVVGFPVAAFLGETQDVYATNRVAVTGDYEVNEAAASPTIAGSTDAEYPHRQVIFGEALDNRNNRCRIAGLSRRFTLPLFHRAIIHVSFAHRLWIAGFYGGPGTPTGYFSLWYGAPGGTLTEIAGSRRYSFRTIPASYSPDITPYLVHHRMVGALDSSVVTQSEDFEVFVGFTAGATTFFYFSNAGSTRNGNRLDILNTAMCVRVYKDYTS